jgi:hypothetical protein
MVSLVSGGAWHAFGLVVPSSWFVVVQVACTVCVFIRLACELAGLRKVRAIDSLLHFAFAKCDDGSVGSMDQGAR